MINIEKLVWDPQKDIEWLGFKIYLAKGEFSVPDHKLFKLRLQLQELGLRTSTHVSKKAGQLNWENHVNVLGSEPDHTAYDP